MNETDRAFFENLMLDKFDFLPTGNQAESDKKIFRATLTHARGKQEPVAWMHPHGAIWRFDNFPNDVNFNGGEWQPLYTAPPAQSDDETYEVGKRDGYEQAVQDIDTRTGGDGEYRFCTDGDPDRHTPDAATMINRIVGRFTAEREENARLRAENASKDALLEPAHKMLRVLLASPASKEPEKTYEQGIADAAAWVQSRVDDYVREHGVYDPSTGATEFPGNGDETVGEWEEIIEGINSLAASPGPVVDTKEPENISNKSRFESVIARARIEAQKAILKFPQPNYVLLKVAEEAGEVVRAGIHVKEGRMPWEEVEKEAVQLAAMLYRLLEEGDGVIGLAPPADGGEPCR